MINKFNDLYVIVTVVYVVVFSILYRKNSLYSITYSVVFKFNLYMINRV